MFGYFENWVIGIDWEGACLLQAGNWVIGMERG